MKKTNSKEINLERKGQELERPSNSLATNRENVVTEIATQNIENWPLSVIKNEDRTADGNLLPEVRERTINELKKYLQRIGYINISEISSMINLSRQTTKKLVDEILDDWREDEENQIIVQKKWYESVIRDIENKPEMFNEDYINIIKLKSAVLGKINSLQKLSQKEMALNHKIINLYLTRQENQKKLSGPESKTDQNNKFP